MNSFNIIEHSGYPGIFFLMILENVFPPMPSKIIVPFAGYVAAQGKLSAIGGVIATTLGSTCGTFAWYELARWIGEERLRRLVARHGRWIALNQREITRASNWFDRYGTWTVFFGRLVPTVRTLVSIPAGLACMPPLKFFLYTPAGSCLWVCALTGLGLRLNQHYERVQAWLSPVTDAVIAVIVITYIWRVIRYKPE